MVGQDSGDGVSSVVWLLPLAVPVGVDGVEVAPDDELVVSKRRERVVQPLRGEVPRLLLKAWHVPSVD